jgi:thymidylate synthase (FAD)
MKNTVELIGYYGSDVVVAQSAWTSTSRELSEDKLKRVPALIKMLWENGHETPFEKCNVHFLVTTDIATHIHLLKHRISSINAESARYKELKEDKFYLPEDWKGIQLSKSVLDDDGIFAIGKDDVGEDAEEWTSILEFYTELGNNLYHQCLEDLTPILGRARAKESARFFKTYNSQITADVQFNLRSFANFLKLRLSPHAQLEVREVAKEMVEQVSNIEGNPFKEVLNVWKEENVW